MAWGDDRYQTREARLAAAPILTSWWVGLTREQFSVALAREIPRICASPMAAKLGDILLGCQDWKNGTRYPEA